MNADPHPVFSLDPCPDPRGPQPGIGQIKLFRKGDKYQIRAVLRFMPEGRGKTWYLGYPFMQVISKLQDILLDVILLPGACKYV